MEPAKQFLEYATAFEQTFADDDWARLKPYFAADAVYAVTGEAPLGGRWEGRKASRRARRYTDDRRKLVRDELAWYLQEGRVPRPCVRRGRARNVRRGSYPSTRGHDRGWR